MAKYVPDIGSRRWVIIAPGRSLRPNQEKKTAETSHVCPFCVGSEHMTPPELYRIGTGEKDKPGWLVRVVPNKYPITDTHEVIIHGPDDDHDIEDLPIEQVVRILTAYRDRYRAHDDAGQVLFKDGKAVTIGWAAHHIGSHFVNIGTFALVGLAMVVGSLLKPQHRRA